MSYTEYIEDLLNNSTKEELISMYEMFEQSKSEAWQMYSELKIESDKNQILFEEITSKLNKALDIACKKLSWNCKSGMFCERIKGYCNGNHIECWKEYLLQESEKE